MRQGIASKKKIPVEVLVDFENTFVLLDCSCCPDVLARRLPGGFLIPIASALKHFFEKQGMRNIDVTVQGNMMHRTYRGVMQEPTLPDMESEMQKALDKFTKKRKSR